MRDGQPLGWQTAFLHQLPAPLAIAPEPEETISGLDLAGDIAPGNEIEVPILIEITQGYSWLKDKHEFKFGWDLRFLGTEGFDYAGGNGF